MLPRNPADYRSLLWAAVMPVVLIAQFVNPRLVPYLSPVSFYLAMAAGTMAHNHNHCPTFSSKRANVLYALWISVFYGYPTFAWVPTHNLNHHKHVNREGDATITWRYTNRNTWWMAIAYYFVSAYYQKAPIDQYIRRAKESNPRLFKQIVTQYIVWGSMLVLTLAVAVVWHGMWGGLHVWGFSFALPALFGSFTMITFNYMQHVHTDPWSKWDHSRNFNGYIMNFLVFNNGFHAVHHANAGAHWSTLRREHEKVQHLISPELNLGSFWYWIVRAYLVPAFIPSLETKQLGRAPFDSPFAAARAKAKSDAAPVTDEVDALEAGNNAQIA